MVLETLTPGRVVVGTDGGQRATSGGEDSGRPFGAVPGAAVEPVRAVTGTSWGRPLRYARTSARIATSEPHSSLIPRKYSIP